jgi:hypothetical protein
MDLLRRMVSELSEVQQARFVAALDRLPAGLSNAERLNYASEWAAVELSNDGERNPLTSEALIKVAVEGWKAANAKDGMHVDEMLSHLSKDPHYSDMLLSKASTLLMGWMLKWVEHGLPVIKVSPKYAAAAMATRTTPEVLADLRPPWEAFMISMPKTEVLYLFDNKEKPYPVSEIYVLCVDGKWSMLVSSPDSTISTWRSGVPPERLADEVIEELKHEPLEFLRVSSKDDQTMSLTGRLVIAVVCGMTNQDHVVEVDKKTHDAYRNRRRSSKVPVARVYQINEPIFLDLVEAVRGYQLGTHRKGHRLNVQTMVTGHRKNQPHGPRQSLRKTIWVMPYWRGPEDAPIAVRPHAIK